MHVDTEIESKKLHNRKIFGQKVAYLPQDKCTSGLVTLLIKTQVEGLTEIANTVFNNIDLIRQSKFTSSCALPLTNPDQEKIFFT